MSATLSELRVLVVDDHRDTRDMLEMILRLAGARVTSVGSVAEALDAFSTTDLDVVVTDISMPHEDGYVLLRHVRTHADAARRRTPVIAFTAHTDTHSRSRALAEGFREYVTKPVDPDLLCETLERVMHPRAPSSPPGPSSGRRPTVLVVDDIEDSRGVMVVALEAGGFAVREASSGVEALRLAGDRVDVVLLDVRLPDIDGFEVCRRIKNEPATARVPVVHVSAVFLESEDRARGLEDGADAFLTKPLDPRELVATVTALLRIRKAEATHSEHYFQSLIEYGSDIVAVLTADGTLRYGSPAIERVLGYDTETFLGKNIFDFVHSDDAPNLQALLEAAIRRLGATRRVTFRFRHKDSGWRVLEGVTTNLLDDASVQGIIINARDVTDRRRAEDALRESEEALRESERLLQAIFDTEPECVKLMTLDGRLLKMNRAGLAMIEADDLGQLAGCSVYPLIADEDRPAFQRLMDGARHGEAGILEFDMVGLRGTRRSMETHTVPFRDRDGRITAALAIARDVSDRKRAEADLRASEERFRLLFAHNPHPMWVYDVETLEFLEVNDTAIKRYGYSRDEFLRMRLRDVRMDGDVSRLEENGVREPPEIEVTGPWRHRLKNGNLIEVQVARHLLTFEGRRAALAVVEDITERRRFEEHFRHGQKMESIGRLAGGVAHDFNNLLTIIGGRAQLVLNRIESQSRVRADVELIAAAVDRAARLTRQLLAFSRKQVLQKKPIVLESVVDGMLAMLRPLIGEDIDLMFRPRAVAGTVLADPGQLEQVLANLAVNARDAMPAGGRLTVEIQMVALDGPAAIALGLSAGRYAELAVRDTGTGMDGETQARIFEPFFTTKGPGQGTGLGLSTVYGIVTQHNGSISVESQPGKGSTFRVYLPIVEQLESDARSAVVPEPAPSLRGAETLLLVEDEDDVRSVVAEVLRNYGYTVLEARGGQEALALAEKDTRSIHLLVTDVIMPGISGRTLAERLVHVRPGMKVLYVSGYTDDLIARHGVLEPGVMLLQKPFAHATLAARVRATLDAPATES